MNRTAKRLGLKTATYRIPYGDGGGENEMTLSPRDLAKLAWTAMQNPVFRKYVGTQKYEGHVTQPDGSPRTIEWTNTNRLLAKEGYDGVKTGSTTAAGSCLVTSCHHAEDHLFCVVLGSTSDAGRYVDTQNLLRWAWVEREKLMK
jgi:D-alanyl-D-alanine carboxypeptidase (penicillin-binding protein 5/6)